MGKDLSEAIDVFALGAVFYNLATGRLPFAGNNIAEVALKVKKGDFEDPRTFNRLLSDDFCDLISSCLAVRPRDRPGSAVELRDRIRELLHAHGVSEIRQEIIDYERNPSTHAVTQRERQLAMLTRDLKLAVKDRDESGVAEIAERMQVIAPLGRRIRDVGGIEFDGSRARLSPEGAPRDPVPWFLAGTLVGGAVGALGALSLLAMGLIPTEVMVWFDKFADLLGLGY